jgi:hypothetical protein
MACLEEIDPMSLGNGGLDHWASRLIDVLGE